MNPETMECQEYLNTVYGGELDSPGFQACSRHPWQVSMNLFQCAAK